MSKQKDEPKLPKCRPCNGSGRRCEGCGEGTEDCDCGEDSMLEVCDYCGGSGVNEFAPPTGGQGDE